MVIIRSANCSPLWLSLSSSTSSESDFPHNHTSYFVIAERKGGYVHGWIGNLALNFEILIISLMTNKFLSLLLASLLILTAAQGNQCSTNTFQVTGNGRVAVSPDIVTVTIESKGNGSSSGAALSKLNTQVNAILAVFNNLRIPPSNYSTSSISINQLYNYSNTPVTPIGS